MKNILILVLIALVIVGGVYLYFGNQKEVDTPLDATPITEEDISSQEGSNQEGQTQIPMEIYSDPRGYRFMYPEEWVMNVESSGLIKESSYFQLFNYPYRNGVERSGDDDVKIEGGWIWTFAQWTDDMTRPYTKEIIAGKEVYRDSDIYHEVGYWVSYAIPVPNKQDRYVVMTIFGSKDTDFRGIMEMILTNFTFD
jgi:hypothetical protein